MLALAGNEPGGSMIQASSRVALVACGVVMLAALAFASSAFAARHGLFAEVALKSSNGYYVSIVAHRWKRPPGRGEVSVSVQKDNPFAASYGRTAYTTHGKLAKHRLKANLGSFGRIALRFRPNARRGGGQQPGPTPPPGSLATRIFQPLVGWGRGGRL